MMLPLSLPLSLPLPLPLSPPLSRITPCGQPPEPTLRGQDYPHRQPLAEWLDGPQSRRPAAAQLTTLLPLVQAQLPVADRLALHQRLWALWPACSPAEQDALRHLLDGRLARWVDWLAQPHDHPTTLRRLALAHLGPLGADQPLAGPATGDLPTNPAYALALIHRHGLDEHPACVWPRLLAQGLSLDRGDRAAAHALIDQLSGALARDLPSTLPATATTGQADDAATAPAAAAEPLVPPAAALHLVFRLGLRLDLPDLSAQALAGLKALQALGRLSPAELAEWLGAGQPLVLQPEHQADWLPPGAPVQALWRAALRHCLQRPAALARLAAFDPPGEAGASQPQDDATLAAIARLCARPAWKALKALDSCYHLADQDALPGEIVLRLLASGALAVPAQAQLQQQLAAAALAQGDLDTALGALAAARAAGADDKVSVTLAALLGPLDELLAELLDDLLARLLDEPRDEPRDEPLDERLDKRPGEAQDPAQAARPGTHLPGQAAACAQGRRHLQALQRLLTPVPHPADRTADRMADAVTTTPARTATTASPDPAAAGSDTDPALTPDLTPDLAPELAYWLGLQQALSHLLNHLPDDGQAAPSDPPAMPVSHAWRARLAPWWAPLTALTARALEDGRLSLAQTNRRADPRRAEALWTDLLHRQDEAAPSAATRHLAQQRLERQRHWLGRAVYHPGGGDLAIDDPAPSPTPVTPATPTPSTAPTTHDRVGTWPHILPRARPAHLWVAPLAPPADHPGGPPPALLVVPACLDSRHSFPQVGLLQQGLPGHHLLFLNNPAFDWYCDTSFEAVCGLIKDRVLPRFRPEQVCAYYGSMGGHAALKLALQFGWRAVAFNPQVDLDLWSLFRPAEHARLQATQAHAHLADWPDAAWAAAPLYLAVGSATPDRLALSALLRRLRGLRHGRFIIEKFDDPVHAGLIHRIPQRGVADFVARTSARLAALRTEAPGAGWTTHGPAASASFWDELDAARSARVEIALVDGQLHSAPSLACGSRPARHRTASA